MYLDKVKNQLIELKLVKQDELVGCTRDDVIAIEQKLGICLPRAYQEFLLSMGRSAGQFLRGSDCFFNHLPQLQEWGVELLHENNFAESLPGMPLFSSCTRAINSAFFEYQKVQILRLTHTAKEPIKLFSLKAMRALVGFWRLR